MTLTQRVKALEEAVRGLRPDEPERVRELRSYHYVRWLDECRREKFFQDQLKEFGLTSKLELEEMPCSCGKHKGLTIFVKREGKWQRSVEHVCPVSFLLFRCRCHLRGLNGNNWHEWITKFKERYWRAYGGDSCHPRCTRELKRDGRKQGREHT